jgi:hypothetical protein
VEKCRALVTKDSIEDIKKFNGHKMLHILPALKKQMINKYILFEE